MFILNKLNDVNALDGHLFCFQFALLRSVALSSMIALLAGTNVTCCVNITLLQRTPSLLRTPWDLVKQAKPRDFRAVRFKVVFGSSVVWDQLRGGYLQAVNRIVCFECGNLAIVGISKNGAVKPTGIYPYYQYTYPQSMRFVYILRKKIVVSN